MPPKKQVPTKKRTPKKTKRSSAPVNEALPISDLLDTISSSQEELILTPVPDQPVVVEGHTVHFRQAVFLSIGFMVLFTSFLFVSTKMKAQENSASVSAVVAPNEFNTRQPKKMTWWDTIDPYTKLYAGTGVVGAFVVGLGALTLLPKKKTIA